MSEEIKPVLQEVIWDYGTRYTEDLGDERQRRGREGGVLSVSNIRPDDPEL